MEPKVKLLLGRPLLNKLKPKELQQMGTQYQGLFDENDVSKIFKPVSLKLICYDFSKKLTAQNRSNNVYLIYRGLP